MTQQSHCWAYTPRKSMSKFYWLLLQDLQNLATYHCSTWSKPSSFLLWIIGMVFRLPPLPPNGLFSVWQHSGPAQTSSHTSAVSTPQQSPCSDLPGASISCPLPLWPHSCPLLCSLPFPRERDTPLPMVLAPARPLPLLLLRMPFFQTLP